MTVSSLWKSLNRGGSGQKIGEKELASGETHYANALSGVNPWNVNQHPSSSTGRGQSLAIDLSIWICESLTSHGMNEQNTNPALQLVFARTVKLLNLGIKLIAVIEGKSRICTGMGEDDKFRKRRTGTAFWKACNDCQTVLELLGVPVVRAKAEGEALCALLCQRGVVDGVISNDGDCLLFGAKVVYTKYSNENLDKGEVIRYDLESLIAVDDHAGDNDENEDHVTMGDPTTLVQLSRQDLIAFAILTGSDIAGSGLAKVGHKKAIRFIRKCKSDNPLTQETAALDEMKAWARAASAKGVRLDVSDADNQEFEGMKKTKQHCCSRCCHPGSKRNHLKEGCDICGTEPGEQCYKVTAEDKFRKSLRAKALTMQPKFEPSKVLSAYLSPNGNQIPIQFVHVTSSSLQMYPPKLRQMLQMNLIVKGQSLTASRAYLQHTVGRLLSRNEILRPQMPAPAGHASERGIARLPQDRPVPKEIQKALVQKGVECFQILWIVNPTVTDENGDGVDGYDFITIDARHVIQDRYPELVAAFKEAEKERQKQGDAEKVRRKEFLDALLFGTHVGDEGNGGAKWRGAAKQSRDTFFQKQDTNTMVNTIKVDGQGGDVANLLFCVSKPFRDKSLRHKRTSSLSPLRGPPESGAYTPIQKPSKRSCLMKLANEEENLCLTPSQPLFCDLGELTVSLTPIQSDTGVYPPRHVFVHCKR